MNRKALVFNLRQARDEMDRLIRESEAGERDDDGPYVLGQEFAIIQSYLCNAWHHHKLSSEALQSLPPDDATKLSRCIPNFCHQFEFDADF